MSKMIGKYDVTVTTESRRKKKMTCVIQILAESYKGAEEEIHRVMQEEDRRITEIIGIVLTNESPLQMYNWKMAFDDPFSVDFSRLIPKRKKELQLLADPFGLTAEQADEVFRVVLKFYKEIQ